MSTIPATIRESRIESILSSAYRENRTMLFEYEVYEILGYLGVKVPRHIIVRTENDITAHSLSFFSTSRIVLKIVSPAVAHKEKIGGVKVVHKDIDFVKYTYRTMTEKFTEKGYGVAGVLMVEYVDYSKEIGDEIFLGFRESEAFGPVLSFSKGGSDAVHFATHFSPPNLVLPPIDRDWAHALLSSTKIQIKFLEQGKTDYISHIVEAMLKLSELATSFSNFFPSDTGFTLKEFEINPFVFDRDGNFIALDGYATFSSRASVVEKLTLLPKRTLKPFFEPGGIAVIGISERDNAKAGNIIVKNFVELKRSDIYCVNKKGGSTTIAGKNFTLYKSVMDISDKIDVAIITVPADATLSAVQECGQKGVKALVLIPGGFSETTKNSQVEQEILNVSRSFGMRIIGPNCLGIIYGGDGIGKGINTFFIPENKFKVNFERKKNVAILSQSGAMGIMEIDNLRNAISPKVVVSYGNQLDIDASDLVSYFQDDPSVDVIGLYIEGFKPCAGRIFFSVASQSKKPIIAYKAGRTEAGMHAAQSHTASIAGEYEVAKTAMKQAGIIVADSMIDHGDLVKTFALLHDFQVSGRNVAVIANAGYEKTAAADSIGSLKLATLSDETHQRLREILPSFVSSEVLLDLTPMVSDEQFTDCIDIFLESPEIDALCISIVPHAQVIHTTDEEIDSYRKNIAARIVEAVHRYKKPVVVSVNVICGADAVYNKFGQVLDRGGIPTFLSASRAMMCLNEFIRYKLIKEKNVINEWLR
ncbi:MAG: acetate--CoA ligase family protein [Chitinivibrionales bacterium]|nr:acetate--CoA ligase family protein [Chitinivibrionales bacterium]